MSRERTLSFCRIPFRIEVIAESCLNGSSEMVGQLAAAVTTLLFNWSMLKLSGKDGVAAITIMNYLQFLFHGLYIGYVHSVIQWESVCIFIFSPNLCVIDGGNFDSALFSGGNRGVAGGSGGRVSGVFSCVACNIPGVEGEV